MSIPTLVDLTRALETAPYAYHQPEELIELFAVDPVAAVSALRKDARVHRQADNWIKAAVISDLADAIADATSEKTLHAMAVL